MDERLKSPYDESVDYTELAEEVPELSPFLNATPQGRASIDFRSEEAVRVLNRALLKRDFELDVELPPDRLCPSVPGRLDYVLYCLELVRRTRRQQALNENPQVITGLDVGTGASAIYPLLAVRYAASRAPRDLARVHMLATDINDKSLGIARKNIVANDLASEISVHCVEADGPIFPSKVIEAASRIDFTLCNPPFYASLEEIATSEAGKAQLPFAVCTGADNEMVTPGGEVAFVSRMIQESQTLGQANIRWFTSLLGKYSSITPLVNELKRRKILNYHVSSLPTRGHTTRWVLAWSLQDWRIPPYFVKETLARDAAPPIPPAPSFPLKRFLSPSVAPLVFAPAEILGPETSTYRVTISALRKALAELVCASRADSTSRDFDWSEETINNDGGTDEPDCVVRVTAWRNVWSRKARRAAAAAANARPAALGALGAVGAEVEKNATVLQSHEPPTDRPPMLELQIEVRPVPASSEVIANRNPKPPRVRVEGWWIRGFDHERSALEGLWNFLTRRIGDVLREQAEIGRSVDGVEVDREEGKVGEEIGGREEEAVGAVDPRKKRKLQ
ncbi:hypothetical protein JCM10908_007330 [Rhodotorula pacifica]|uniref:uncharacterized protein n=1 Tax=Rhodotorula pacifica TaxID=1495444 RepID=UPI00317DDF69